MFNSPRPITWWLRGSDDHTPLRFEMYEVLPSLAVGMSTDVQTVTLENVMNVGVTRFNGGVMDLPLVEVQSWNDLDLEIGKIVVDLLDLLTRIGPAHGLAHGQFTGLITEVTRIPTSEHNDTPWLRWATLGLLYSPNGFIDIMGPDPESTELLRVNPDHVGEDWIPSYHPLPPANRVSRYERPWVI